MIVYYCLYFRIYSTMLILRFQPVDGELTNCSTLLTLQGKGKYIQHLLMHQNHAYIAGKGQTYPRNVSASKIEDILSLLFFNRETTCSLAKQFNCYVFEMRTNEEVNLKLSFYPSNITLSIILSDNQNIYSNSNNNIGPNIHEQFCSKVFFPNFS